MMRRWSRWVVRTVLIGAALGVAGGVAAYLVRTEPATVVGASFTDKNLGHDALYFVTLTFKELRPQENAFAGAVAVEVAPDFDYEKPGSVEKWVDEHHVAAIDFLHYDWQRKSSLIQGGTDDKIPLVFPALRGSLQGKGTFTWKSVAQRSGFFYPFDRYVLQVNPSLVQVRDQGPSYSYRIDSMTMDFGGSNFVPHFRNLEAKYPNDPYEVTVQRPVLQRVLAGIVAVLLLVWLGYLIVAAKAGEYAGQVVTLFVGVFSIRSSLLSGAPVFPSLIDYWALGIYLSAVLIVLIKWMVPDVTTKVCVHCASAVPLKAAVCPFCTLRPDVV